MGSKIQSRCLIQRFVSMAKVCFCLGTWGSAFAFQHLKHIVACDADAKEALPIDLADVSDFVAGRGDDGDGSLESPLSIRCCAQAETSMRPNVRSEEQGRQLTEIEIIDDAEWVQTLRARPECACQGLAFAFRQSLLNPPRGRLTKTLGVDLAS